MTPTPLEAALAEYDARQAAREQYPTAVTTRDCRHLIAALRYAVEWAGLNQRDDDGRGFPQFNDKIAALLRGEATA